MASVTTVSKPIVWHNGYVINVGSNVGWNQQPSRLTLSIVDVPDEDFETGLAARDIENPSAPGYQIPEVGSFQTFDLQSILTYQGVSGVSSPFKFQGIVMSHEIPKRTDSAKIHQTTVHDTREVINNIPVVLSSVARTVQLPQSINAFSWYDVWWPFVGTLNVANNTEFGMSWEKIRNAINGVPLTSKDLNDAWLPDFAQYRPNFDADGVYITNSVWGWVHDRGYDTPSTLSNHTMNDSVASVSNKRNEILPPKDWTFDRTAIPSGWIDCDPVRYSQPTQFTAGIYVRNFGRASGQVIHMDTGLVIDQQTQASSGSINPAIFNFYGTRYKINLDKIPIQDVNFRIRGDVVYLGELIDKVASWGQFDWFVKETVDDGTGVKEIKIDVVDRKKAIGFDEQAFNDWLDNIKESGGSKVISYSQSRELRNETTMMVLFGSRHEQLMRKAIGGQWYGIQKASRTLETNPLTVALNTAGLALGSLPGNMANERRGCAIDFGHLNIPTFQSVYNFDEYTLRAALYDSAPFGTLFNYLCHINHPMIVDLERYLGISKPGAGVLLDQGQKALIWQYRTLANDNRSARQLLQGITNIGDRALDLLMIIGRVIENFARDYWGRRFIIRNPDSLLMNWDIALSAFQGFQYNEGTAYFRDRDGMKVRGFVVFKKIDAFNVETDLNEREFTIVTNKDIITNGAEIITTTLYDNKNIYDLYIAAEFEVIDNRIIIATISSPVRQINSDISYGRQLSELAQFACRQAFSSQTQAALMGNYGMGFENQCIYPQYAYIPVVAKQDRYGPWVSEGLEIDQNVINGVDENGVELTRRTSKYKAKAGYDGRLEIAYDEELSPWNMGGTFNDPFLGMNQAANARVVNASSNLIKPITAKISVEGLPQHNIGDELKVGAGSSAANISDIAIDLSERQISTSYEVKNYTAKQREYRTEDYKMGTAGLLRTSNIESNLVSIFGGIANKLPRAIATGIRTNKELREARKDRRYISPYQQLYSDPPSQIVAMNLKNTSRTASVSEGKIAIADNEANHANLAYASMAAHYIGAFIGGQLATNVMPGRLITQENLIGNSLK